MHPKWVGANYVQKEVNLMRRSIINENDKKKIEALYSRGVSIRQIEKRLNSRYKLDTIKSYIRRNLSHLKERHEIERCYNKEILSKTYKECMNSISTRSFFKYNKSIYKQNKKGDLVINREVAPITTFDTPKKLKHKIKFE